MEQSEVTVTETDLGYMAICTDLPGLCGMGDDVDEAVDDLMDAIDRYMRGININ